MERIIANRCDRWTNSQRFQPGAGVEGIVGNGGNRVGDGHADETITHGKCVGTNILERRWQVDVGQIGALGEGIISDAGNCVGKSYMGQTAEHKGTPADSRDGVG